MGPGAIFYVMASFFDGTAPRAFPRAGVGCACVGPAPEETCDGAARGRAEVHQPFLLMDTSVRSSPSTLWRASMTLRMLLICDSVKLIRLHVGIVLSCSRIWREVDLPDPVNIGQPDLDPACFWASQRPLIRATDEALLILVAVCDACFRQITRTTPLPARSCTWDRSFGRCL